jgi:tetratricopeptide (TPR) repeat protein
MQTKKDRTMKRITKPLFFGRIIALACVCPTSAFAAPPPAKSVDAQTVAPKMKAPQVLVKSGEAKYLAGDYSGALADFTDADAQKPSPQTARYVGLCQDKLGHLSEAIAAYKRFLIAPPADLAAQGDPIRARVSEILATPGKIHVETTPAGALVSVDGSSTTATGPTDLSIAPGKHTLHVTTENHVAKDHDIDVSYASTQTVNVALDDAPPPPAPVVVAPPPPPHPAAPPPPPPHHDLSRTFVAITAGGLAVVAAGIGTAFGVIALSDKNDFDKNPTFDKGNQANDFAVYCDTALGAAAVLGATSIILFLSDHDDASGTSNATSNAPKFSAAPMMTPHGGGASALLRF